MNVLITGARGVVGPSLVSSCTNRELAVTGSGRAEGGERWVRWNMADNDPPFGDRFDIMLHAAPLWLLAGRVAALADRGVNRIIALSSTSVLSKRASTSEKERRLADALERAETRILEQSAHRNVNTTLFRPTMIYGFGRDANVSAIAGFIRRYGFFPVAGPASGRRQPIHADDVAEALTAAILCQASFGKTYSLAGGETLTYHDMVDRIFDGLGKSRRTLAVPSSLYRLVLDLVSVFLKGVSGEMAGRMNVDLVFDDAEARQDLSFSPQRFLEQPGRDLVRP